MCVAIGKPSWRPNRTGDAAIGSSLCPERSECEQGRRPFAHDVLHSGVRDREWVVYGVLKEDAVIILANSVSLCPLAGIFLQIAETGVRTRVSGPCRNSGGLAQQRPLRIAPASPLCTAIKSAANRTKGGTDSPRRGFFSAAQPLTQGEPAIRAGTEARGPHGIDPGRPCAFQPAQAPGRAFLD
jgi:hypothetical protein